MAKFAMPCEVFRWSLGDCTNGGVTATATTVLLVEDPEPGEFKDSKLPVLVLERHPRYGLRAMPLERPKGMVGPMMGGNYVHSCDSRFTEHVSGYPIPVHDRFETPEHCAMMD